MNFKDETRGIVFSKYKSVMLKYNPDLPVETCAVPSGVTVIYAGEHYFLSGMVSFFPIPKVADASENEH